MRKTFTPYTFLTTAFLFYSCVANIAKAQVFIAEDFNAVSNPNLPSGWSSSPAAMWVTGNPDATTPNALGALNYTLTTPNCKSASRQLFCKYHQW